MLTTNPAREFKVDKTHGYTTTLIYDATISSKITLDTGETTYGGYTFKVKILNNADCTTFNIAALTINAVNILDYQDSTQDFTDPGNEAGKESCGDRDIVLLDADNGDAEISGHAWIALAL